MKKGNIVSSIISILVAVFVLYETKDFPSGAQNVPGPAFFPRIIAILIIGLSGLLIVMTYIRKEERNINFTSKNDLKAYITIAIILVYIVLMNILGFIIATPLFLITMIYYYGMRNYVKNIIISVGVTALIFTIFKILLAVPLPQGIFLG